MGISQGCCLRFFNKSGDQVPTNCKCMATGLTNCDSGQGWRGRGELRETVLSSCFAAAAVQIKTSKMFLYSLQALRV